MIYLSNLLTHLSGYVEMAYPVTKLSVAEFEISELRKGIYAKDPERVIKNLNDVLKSVVKHNAPLAEQRLTAQLIEQLEGIKPPIPCLKRYLPHK